MPDLYFKVGVQGGKATISELNNLDAAYQKVGSSSTKHFQEGEKAASVFGGSLTNLKHIAIGLGATFGLMGGASMIEHWVEGAMEAEKVWANVTTLLDTTTEETKALYHELKGVSSQLGTTAELAQGMYFALSANIAPDKAVKFVETAAKFGKAALVDIATSTDLLTTVTNAYGLSVEQAGEAADKLFQMVRKGKTTGAELAGSLGMVIPTAAALKVDINQLGAAFVTMTQMGINAHMATTSLNQALVTFLKPTKQAKELAKEYGIELTADALKSKGLAKAMGELAFAVQDNDEAIATIFGNIRAMRAAMALTGSQAKVYEKTLIDLADAHGTVDVAVKKQVETTGAQLSALWTNIAKIMKGVVNSGTGPLFNFLTDLNGVFEKGKAPVHALTYEIILFGLALTGLKLASTISDMKKLTMTFGIFTTFMDARKVLDFGSALKLTLNGMGLLGKAIAVVAVATAAWSFTRLIMETFDLDKKMESLYKRIGLFQGRVAEATELANKGLQKASEAMSKNAESVAMAAKMGETLERNGRSAEEWAAALGRVSMAVSKVHQDAANASLIAELTKKSADLTAQYGDKLKLLNIDVTRGTRSLKDWSDVIAEAAVKVKQKIPLTEEERQKVKELAEAMHKAVNPAAELAEQLSLLQRAGKDVTGFAHAYSKQILDAIDLTEQMNGKVPKSISALKAEAQAFEDAKQKVADLQAEKKKLKDLNEKGIPRAIAGIENPELQANARAWIEHAAAVAKSKDATLTESEAINVAIEKLKWYDGIVTKNKENLKEQLDVWIDQHTQMAIMKKDYDELGISMDKSTLLMEKAYRDQRDKGAMSTKEQTDAISNMVKTTAEQHSKLSADVLNDLNDMAFGTDVNVREKMQPVWAEYYKSLRTANGQWPAEYSQKLTEVMKGNNRLLKKEMLPAWNDYIAAIKAAYGKLPPNIEKMDKQIQAQFEDTAGKMAEVWKEQVSTIFTDFSKGIADMIFEAKSMSDVIVGIFKEFGKMVIRTITETLMSPFKKILTDLAGDLSKSLTKLLKKSSGGDTASDTGGAGDVLGGAGGISGIFSMFTKKGNEGDSSMADLSSVTGGDSGGTGTGAGTSSGGFMGMGDKVGSLVQTGLMMGGSMLAMSGISNWKSNSVSSWLKSVGGGAMIGTAIMPGIGTIVGAAVGALAKGIGSLVSWAKGKTNAEAGTDEIARDFGGVKMSQDLYSQMTSSFGFDPNGGQLWRARGDVAGGPQMLDQIFQLAKQQGKLKAMYDDMNTAWSGFHKNFTEGLEIGELTGDWTQLNEEWKKSTSYADMVKRGLKAEADAMVMGGDAAFEAAKQFETYYQEALKTGSVTKEFTKYIEDNRSKLEEYAKTSNIMTGQLAKMDQVMAEMKLHAADLAGLENLTTGFQTLKDGLEAFAPAIKSSLDLFLEDGVITEDLRQKIEKLGGSVADFETLAGSLKTSNYFGTLVAQFKETGEVLPDLKVLFSEFGGSLDELKKASELKDLKTAATGLTEFASGIKELIPETTGLQDALNGIYDAQKLSAQGLDAGMFKSITNIIGAMGKWDAAVADFQQTGRLTEGGIPEVARQVMDAAGLTSGQLDKVEALFSGNTKKLTSSGKLITDMLTQYGGAEGQHAVDMMKSGFNVVTSDLLASTKTNMDNAYKTEREKVLGYIEQQQNEILERSNAIETAIESQFQIVSENITAAFVRAREAVIPQLDAILTKIEDITKATIGLGTAPAGTPSASDILNTTTTTSSGVAALDFSQLMTDLQGSNADMMAKFSDAVSNLSAEVVAAKDEAESKPKVIQLNLNIENNGNIYQNDLETRVLQIMKDALAGGGFTGVVQ